MFTAWIHGDRFTCLGARAADQRQVLRYGEFGALGSTATARELHAVLEDFVAHWLSPEENFASFVAVFSGPHGVDELEFERLTWEQLVALHEIDRRTHGWARGVSRDPHDPRFAYSVAGHAFFVVGMHERASRISRRFVCPALAFNSHEQFERLRAQGLYGRLQRRIRTRELALQRSLKPNLAAFGADTDAKQYAGRHVGPDWVCPARAAFVTVADSMGADGRGMARAGAAPSPAGPEPR